MPGANIVGLQLSGGQHFDNFLANGYDDVAAKSKQRQRDVTAYPNSRYSPISTACGNIKVINPFNYNLTLSSC